MSANEKEKSEGDHIRQAFKNDMRMDPKASYAEIDGKTHKGMWLIVIQK